MPLYLCRAGTGKPEPWRHGVSVYPTPFADAPEAPAPRLLRRLRHGEIVLVDDVCFAHDKHWLRLRWPGNRGGFAGYLRLDEKLVDHPSAAPDARGDADTDGADDNDARDLLGKQLRVEDIVEDRGGTEEGDADDPAREETASMPSADPADASAVTCLRTGLVFPSAANLQLLQVYDDGINPAVAIYPFNTEPVFCRICREGLHEDADDAQPEAENDETENRARGIRGMIVESRQGSTDDIPEEGQDDDEDGVVEQDAPAHENMVMRVDPNDPTVVASEPQVNHKGPVLPHPLYSTNPHAMENPLMAPCECAGSMAFVHYLCVEEWRCRSRHPEARNGLNCETCGAAYALPPPAARPQVLNSMDDDMMDAMPPHVMQALREPHIWWRIGAAVVRRRWLRPVAPILMSPIVSLYCRARRLLKKRGVARRRWACSLCRRRARWKCVRCLRSYYCSRQCQNVSWHIVHKHLCYKPSRLAWSSVIYGLAAVSIFPGILRDPLMYDLGLLLIPMSFVVSAVLAGSVATMFKKTVGYDVRGRLLEFIVLLSTMWLALMSWALVQAFFGEPSACLGIAGRLQLNTEVENSSWLLSTTRKFVLQPAKWYYLQWDMVAANAGEFINSLLCNSEKEGSCFAHVPSVDFYLQNDSCAADWVLFLYLYLCSAAAFVVSFLFKMRERHVRQQQREMHNRELRQRRRLMAQRVVMVQAGARLHQD